MMLETDRLTRGTRPEPKCSSAWEVLVCLVSGRPRPTANCPFDLCCGGAGSASGWSTARTAAESGGLDDVLRAASGEDEGGEDERGAERITEGFVEAMGDDDGVVNAVDDESSELLLPKENQEPERVVVEADDEVVDDALDTESRVVSLTIRETTVFLALTVVWTSESWRSLPFSITLSAGSSRIVRSSVW